MQRLLADSYCSCFHGNVLADYVITHIVSHVTSLLQRYAVCVQRDLETRPGPRPPSLCQLNYQQAGFPSHADPLLRLTDN